MIDRLPRSVNVNHLILDYVFLCEAQNEIAPTSRSPATGLSRHRLHLVE